jgi:hypothetical protein
MGKLTGMMPALPASTMDIRESAELMTATMQAMAGASELPVTRIKVPSGGGKYFTVDDDLPPAAAIEGVIMAAQYMNVYWDKPMGEGDSAPTCSSADGMSGWYIMDGELMERSCLSCPMNKMRSAANGRGKACKNIVKLMMLVDGQALPVEVKVPVMSVANFSRYLAREIVARNLKIWQVTTKLTLKEATNGNGIKYSQITFECTGRVDDEEIMALRGAVAPLMLGAGEEVKAD